MNQRLNDALGGFGLTAGVLVFAAIASTACTTLNECRDVTRWAPSLRFEASDPSLCKLRGNKVCLDGAWLRLTCEPGKKKT